MAFVCKGFVGALVAPYAGAWIEIVAQPVVTNQYGEVAPYAGAWIEIAKRDPSRNRKAVAPYAGAWIEIDIAVALGVSAGVAPYAGAWIEICLSGTRAAELCRSLRGSVD